MRSTDPITDVTARTVPRRLPRELRLGPMTVNERIYVLVRIRTRSGLTGHAYAQTRGAPVAEVLDALLRPVLLGADAAAVEARWRDCYRSTLAIGRTGLLMRAISLIDIALWDIQAQRADLPLHRLLGGIRDRVPVMFVAAYLTDRTDIDELLAAALAAARDGHRLLKVARAPDPAVTREALHRLRDALPPHVRVVVDVSWAWQRADEAAEEVAGWPVECVAWLEDPFPPENVAAYRRLQATGFVALGAGDEVTDPRHLEALVGANALDVVRLDVATIGGITAAVRVLHQAENWALPVSMHISPEVSAHLAGAFPTITSIETFNRSGNRYDPSHELSTGGPRFTEGDAVLGETPGVGWQFPVLDELSSRGAPHP